MALDESVRRTYKIDEYCQNNKVIRRIRICINSPSSFLYIYLQTTNIFCIDIFIIILGYKYM